MNWIELSEVQQLDQIKELSHSKPQVIFKHSTRCFISSMIKKRLEASAAPDNIDFYYLDLIRNRSLSNLISEQFSVYHESPQILLIKNGACVYDESHNDIDMTSIQRNAL